MHSIELSESKYTPDFIVAGISIIIGLVAGVITAFFTDVFLFTNSYRDYMISHYPRLYIVIAIVSLFSVAYTLRRLLNTIHGSSTSYVVNSYHKRLGYVGKKELIVYTIGSIFSVLAGAVVGPEGPGIAIGAFTGYWIARILGLHGDNLRKMALVGAAAGIASVFRAPVTAMAFAIEVPYKRSLETGVFIPALVATLTSYIVTVFIAGPQRLLLQLKPFKPPLPTLDIITSSFGLGVTAAVLVYMMYFIKHYAGELSEKYGRSKYWPIFPLLLSALVIIASFYISPLALGSGDKLTEKVINEPESTSLRVLLPILLSKSILLPLSLTWGATGGLFMPLVSIGATLGLIYSMWLHVPPQHIYPLIFAGVSAVFSAAQKTLITSVFIGVEFLGFGAFFSSTIAAATAYLLTLNISMINGQLPAVQDTKKRALVELVGRISDLKELKQLFESRSGIIANAIVTKVYEDMSILDALEVAEKELHNAYPVVNNEEKLVGEVDLETLVSEPEYKKIKEVMHAAPYVRENDTVKQLVDVMIDHQVDRVYVVDHNKTLKGVVSKTDILKYFLEAILSRIRDIRK